MANWGPETDILIDVESLTDGQLVDLVGRAAKVAAARNQALSDAVATAVAAARLSNEEHDRIATQAAAIEAARIREEEARRVAEAAAEAVRREAGEMRRLEASAEQQRLWEKRIGLAQAAKDLLSYGWTLTVWQRDAEKRVYLDCGGQIRDPKISYYHTGNGQHKPGSMTMSHCDGIDRAAALALCQRAAREWHSLRMDVDETLA